MTTSVQSSSLDAAPADQMAVRGRTEELLRQHQQAIWKRTDRLFAGLLAFEWLAGVVVALWRTPWTWEGATRSVHPHVWEAVILGLVIAALPIFLALRHPGAIFTRHVVAASQMLSSALLIHLSGGRLETHFHVFGSLAFIAFYRDWRVMITASAVVAADHLLRNLLAPESVYGVLQASPWRWLEHAGWVIFEDIFLIAACLQGVREMRGIAEQRALLEHSYQVVEEKVKQRTEQLREAQNDLVKVARSAGKAEIATSVLHNVGNVLNSLNVSLQVATSKVQKSPVGDLSKAVEMMGEHKEDLGEFLTEDERGRMIPEFLAAVSEALSSEQTQVLSEMRSLAKNVEHIKEIVSVQQSHAKASNMKEQLRINDILEDAIKVAMATSERTPVVIERKFGETPAILTDKHVLLQILVNLLSNAKQAMATVEGEKKRLVIRTSVHAWDGMDWLRVDITDSGVGIEPANLTRIFNHGFTTKQDGHGFGLHSSANSAKNLGGSLTAQSDGLGHERHVYP